MYTYGMAKCAVCGREFERTNPNQKYCGNVCMLHAQSERGRMYWRMRHDREERKEHQQSEYEEDGERYAEIAIAALEPEQRARLVGMLTVAIHWSDAAKRN